MPLFQNLAQMALADQQAQQRMIQQRLWELEDQDTAAALREKLQRQQTEAVLSRMKEIEDVKNKIEQQQGMERGTAAADFLGTIVPEYSPPQSPDDISPNYQKARAYFSSTGAPQVQSALNDIFTMQKTREEAANKFPGMGTETIQGDDGRNYAVKTWIDPQSKQLQKRIIGLSKEEQAAHEERLLAAYDAGELGKLKTGQEQFAAIDLAMRRDAQISKVVTTTSEGSTPGSTVTKNQMVSPRPGGGWNVTEVAQGTKERPGLTPAEETYIAHEYWNTVGVVQGIDSLLKEIKPQDLSVAQDITNSLTGLYTRVFDPKFNPKEYAGIFENLVKNVPQSEKVKAQLEQAFMLDYRKPVTGAQASKMELDALREQYINGKLPYSIFVARSLGIVERQMQRGRIFKTALDTRTRPDIPLNPEELKKFYNFGSTPPQMPEIPSPQSTAPETPADYFNLLRKNKK